MNLKLKSVLPIKKALDAPDALLQTAWVRGAKTDKVYVRTLTAGQMRNIVNASDRWTLGDIDAGVFSSGSMHAGKYLLSKFSGGYMVVDSSRQN